uniref:Uncharacterized protein n=1 Tax=Glossina pallidipes TaxID=7398 RepID=A0A1B0GGL8_GLOPL
MHLLLSTLTPMKQSYTSKTEVKKSTQKKSDITVSLALLTGNEYLQENKEKSCKLHLSKFSLYANLLTPVLKPPWRNRLARSAVNRKVGGSSPPGGASAMLILLGSGLSKDEILFAKSVLSTSCSDCKDSTPLVVSKFPAHCNWAAADDGAIRESAVVIYDEACEGLAALLPGGGASILGVTAVKVPPVVGNKVAVPLAVAVGTVGGEAATAAKAAMVGLVRVAAAEICVGTKGVAGLMAVPGTAEVKFPKTDVAVGVFKAVIPHKPCSCCNFFWSFSFCVSANFTTNGAEQPSIVWL